jgi:DEAD/DEAH box helicase domain-containing protein
MVQRLEIAMSFNEQGSQKSKIRTKLNIAFWRHHYCLPFSEDIVPSSLFLRNKHFLVFDIETQNLIQDVGGWGNLKELKVSVACAYDSYTDSFSSYQEHELKGLIALCEKRLVIGYNIKAFDLPVLEQYGLNPKKLDIFDIMLDLEVVTRQRFIKLDSVAKGTLQETKSADGLMAVQWWKEKKIDLIIEYCMQDVKVTRDIFEFGRKNGFVRIARTEKMVDVPVSWS